jgi:hypothetical protein
MPADAGPMVFQARLSAPTAGPARVASITDEAARNMRCEGVNTMHAAQESTMPAKRRSGGPVVVGIATRRPRASRCAMLRWTGCRSGRGAMARPDIGEIPMQNPCAQCGMPIPLPDWIEPGDGRISYLWKCLACGYRFEAVAVFDQHAHERRPLAA